MAILNGRSNTSGNAPTTLLDGQINIQQADGILFSRNPDGSIRRTLFPKRYGVSDAAFQVRIFDTYVGIAKLLQSRTVTLPLAALYPAGTPLILADESGSVTASATVTLQITPGSSDTVNGATNLLFTQPYFETQLISDGQSKWVAGGVGGGSNAAALLYTPQALTPAQQRQALANLALSATNLWMDEIQIATNKGSVYGLLDGLADGFADLSGIDTANAANANLQGGAILNQAVDPNTKSLFHFDGANGSTTISDTVPGHTVSIGGTAQISTAQSVFGGASLRINTSGDFVNVAPHVDFGFGTGDFTVNARVRFDSLSGNPCFFDSKTGSVGFELYLRTSSGKIAYLDWNTNAVVAEGTTTIASGTWYDIEVSRSGGTVRTFVNGNLDATGTCTSNYGTSMGFKVGSAFDGTTAPCIGYIDEFRVSNIARHTAAFTPATAAFAYGTSGVLALPSINYALQSTPTKGSIRIRAKATSDAISPNTNFIASLSRAGAIGGTSGGLPNSLDVTLALTATLPDGYSHFDAAEVDLSGLVPGSTLKGNLRTVGTTLGVAVDGWRISAR